VAAVLRKVNSSWLAGRPEDARGCFHLESVFYNPGFEVHASGREACLETYRDFTSNAKIHDFKESSHTTDLWGTTAVATYRFEMLYEMSGTLFRDRGRDVFILARDGGAWLIVSRTVLTDGQERVG